MLDGEKHEFSHPVLLEMNHELNCWTCYNRILNLCGFGETQEEAIEDARQCLTDLWVHIVLQDRLHARTQEVKDFLFRLLSDRATAALAAELGSDSHF